MNPLQLSGIQEDVSFFFIFHGILVNLNKQNEQLQLQFLPFLMTLTQD